MNLNVIDLEQINNNFDAIDEEVEKIRKSAEKERNCSKRNRRNSCDGSGELHLQNYKKAKCTDSSSSSSSDLKCPQLKIAIGSNDQLNFSSASDTSFKSLNSNHSLKVRKRRLKCTSTLFRNMIHRCKSNSNFKENHFSMENAGMMEKRNSVTFELELECNLDGKIINNVEWFRLSGDTSRKDKNRRGIKSKSWNALMDLCTWIGIKIKSSLWKISQVRGLTMILPSASEGDELLNYKSITSFSDLLCESLHHNEESINNKINEEIKDIREFIRKVHFEQANLTKENDILREELKKITSKVEDLETRLRNQESQPKQFQHCAPQPPPPPPPPPPLPTSSSTCPLKLGRANTLPRCGSAPPRISGPRLSITPADIASVKLRKTKDNPVRIKNIVKDSQQPLVTEHMLQVTRAKLGRGKTVAASTPKKQLTELEKCLLQESGSSLTMYRQRFREHGSFRSSEELRMRPYPGRGPAGRCSRSPRSPRSPCSPRANSIPRIRKINGSHLQFPSSCTEFT